MQAVVLVVITILTDVVDGGERRRAGSVLTAGQVWKPGRLQRRTLRGGTKQIASSARNQRAHEDYSRCAQQPGRAGRLLSGGGGESAWSSAREFLGVR